MFFTVLCVTSGQTHLCSVKFIAFTYYLRIFQMSLSFLSKSILHDSKLKLLANVKSPGNYTVNLSLGKFTASSNFNGIEYDCSDLFYKLSRFGRSFSCAPDDSMKFKAELFENDHLLDSKIIERRIFPENGVYNKVSKNGLIGHLFIPDGADNNKHPGILTIGGLGGPRLYRPSLLASRGFVTFEIEYHTTNGKQIAKDSYDLDYIEAGLEFLKSIPQVDRTRIGTMGISRGGEIAMSATRFLNSDNSIKAAVGISSPVWNSCFGPHVYKNKILIPGSQTIAHKDYLKFDRQFFRNMFVKGPEVDKSKFEEIYETNDNIFALDKFHEQMGQETLKETWLKIDEIEADTLFIFGELDKNVPGPACHELVKQISTESVLYENTGHIIDTPYFGFKNELLTARGSDVYFDLGGTQNFHGEAEIDSWEKIVSFFNQKLK